MNSTRLAASMRLLQRLPENLCQLHGPMIGNVVSVSLSDGYTVETTLDPHEQPFLHDHQIDGTPLLPGVMGIEAFAEAALCLLPGWHVEAIEDVNFLAPFKFYRSEPRAVNLRHGFIRTGDRAAGRLPADRPSLPAQSDRTSTDHSTSRRECGLRNKPVPGCNAAMPSALPNGRRRSS